MNVIENLTLLLRIVYDTLQTSRNRTRWLHVCSLIWEWWSYPIQNIKSKLRKGRFVEIIEWFIFYSLISQNAPVLQCLQGGKISPATISILFSFSVGWHALFSICPAKWYVPVEGTDWSVWNFPITPNIILLDIRSNYLP